MIKLISIRVPKTGSSSFGDILKQVYLGSVGAPVAGTELAPNLHDPNSPWYTDRAAFKRRWKAFAPAAIEQSRVEVIHSHIPVELFDGLYPDAPRVIFLREPTRCIISGFFFAKAVEHIPVDMTIQEYVRLPYRRNWQSVYAGHSLERFLFVGTMEHFDRDVMYLERLLHWPEVDLSVKLNVSVSPLYYEERDRLLSDRSFLDDVQIYHEEDVALYQEALEQRASRKKLDQV